MSARNGDKARYGRERKRKLELRLGFRALRKSINNSPAAVPDQKAAPAIPESASTEPATSEPGTTEPAPAKEDAGVLGKTAQTIGSALGTVAARLKPKEHAEHESRN